jgi:fibronectin-binding autotransporter adhesin
MAHRRTADSLTSSRARQLLAALAIMLVAAGAAPARQVAAAPVGPTYTWTGASAAGTGLWSDGDNWSCDTCGTSATPPVGPGATGGTGDVVFNSPPSGPSPVLDVNGTVEALVIHGSWVFGPSSSTLHIPQRAATVLSVDGSATVALPFAVSIPETANIKSDITLAGSSLALPGGLTTGHAISLTGTGTLTLSNDADSIASDSGSTGTGGIELRPSGTPSGSTPLLTLALSTNHAGGHPVTSADGASVVLPYGSQLTLSGTLDVGFLILFVQPIAKGAPLIPAIKALTGGGRIHGQIVVGNGTLGPSHPSLIAGAPSGTPLDFAVATNSGVSCGLWFVSGDTTLSEADLVHCDVTAGNPVDPADAILRLPLNLGQVPPGASTVATAVSRGALVLSGTQSATFHIAGAGPTATSPGALIAANNVTLDASANNDVRPFTAVSLDGDATVSAGTHTIDVKNPFSGTCCGGVRHQGHTLAVKDGTLNLEQNDDTSGSTVVAMDAILDATGALGGLDVTGHSFTDIVKPMSVVAAADLSVAQLTVHDAPVFDATGHTLTLTAITDPPPGPLVDGFVLAGGTAVAAATSTPHLTVSVLAGASLHTDGTIGIVYVIGHGTTPGDGALQATALLTVRVSLNGGSQGLVNQDALVTGSGIILDHGLVDPRGGTLTFDNATLLALLGNGRAGGSSGGTLVLGLNGLVLNGNTFTLFSVDVRLSGADLGPGDGVIILDGNGSRLDSDGNLPDVTLGDTTPGAILGLTGNLNVKGTFRVNAPSTALIPSGRTLHITGQVVAPSPLTTSSGAGIVSPPGIANLTPTAGQFSTIHATAGTVVNGGDLTVQLLLQVGGGARIEPTGTIDMTATATPLIIGDGDNTAAEIVGRATTSTVIAIGGGAVLTITANGGPSSPLLIGAMVQGSGGVLKDGSGTAWLSADNAYTGTTRINQGTLVVNGVQGQSDVLLNGGTLAGHGDVGGISGPGVVAPDAGPRPLTATGPVTFNDAADHLAVVLAGTGTYSILDAPYGASLGGNAVLDLRLSPAFTPPAGTTFDILRSPSDTGGFVNAHDGGEIGAGSSRFLVSTHGGSSNHDIVLTTLGPTGTSAGVVPTPNPADHGVGVTLTATITSSDTLAGSPTGSVTFLDGGVAIGSGALTPTDPGVSVATLGPIATFTVGTHHLTVSFGGDPSHQPSTSPVNNLVINPPPPAPPIRGVVMDGWGGLHPYGVQSLNTTGATYWPGWDIARGVSLKSDASGGYQLDGWGGLHAFGTATPRNASGYWPNWDIARGIALCGDGQSGYTLDGYGGVHRFGAATPITDGSHAYWPGWDIARGIVVTADCAGGYTLDGWGGIHRFGTASPISDGSHAYWPNWDIARGIVLRADGQSGYTLDGYGGVHGFGGVADPGTSAHWQGWDIANGLTLAPDGHSGYVLDGWGGVHPFGGALSVTTTGYWPNWDIARGISGG